MKSKVVGEKRYGNLKLTNRKRCGNEHYTYYKKYLFDLVVYKYP